VSLKSHEQKIVQEGQKILKDKVKAEMHQAVVEVGTDICADMDEALKMWLRKGQYCSR
jgi:carboxylate-amine ligase